MSIESKYKKEFMKRFILGGPFGLMLTEFLLVLNLLPTESVTLNSRMYIINFFVSLILGGYLCGISVIYSVEEWGLARQTMYHLLGVTPFFPVAWWMGWLPKEGNMLLIYGLIWLAVYGLLWFAVKAYCNRTAKELNEGLKRYKELNER